MNFQKKFLAVVLCLVSGSVLQVNATELVKTCQEFKKTFLEACQILGNEQCSEKMKFVQEHLNLGGSVIFFEIITSAIEDCIIALTEHLTYSNARVKNITSALKAFETQINSDEMYDLSTGSVFKREILRSGKTKVINVPYNATHCYPIMTQKPASDKK